MVFGRLKRNKDKTSVKTYGRIICVNNDYITIRLDNASLYKKGQFLTIGIPSKRTTALGNTVMISEIVACGEVDRVNQDDVVIKSNFNGPIISRLTIKEKNGQRCNMLVDHIV